MEKEVVVLLLSVATRLSVWALLEIQGWMPRPLTDATLRRALARYANSTTRLMVTRIYGPIHLWDTSRVTDFSMLGREMRPEDRRAFNEPIGNWNVSNVTRMHGTFMDWSRFNQPIESWDVSNVTTMQSMFDCACSFNQPLNAWNTSKTRDMSFLFRDAETFNQPLGAWNVSRVTTMESMFHCARSFNQPIDQWNTSSVTNMQCLFFGCNAFNQPLDACHNEMAVIEAMAVGAPPPENWMVRIWREIVSAMLHGNEAGVGGGWNTSRVTNMEGMFYGTSAFNQYIGDWDVSQATHLGSMFRCTSSFNQPIHRWNVAKNVRTDRMLYEAVAFHQPTPSWIINQSENDYL